jgi:hypothetical protein
MTKMKPNPSSISRREFATRAALGTLAAVAPSTSPFAIDAPPAREDGQTPANTAKLSAQSQTEAEARYQAILSQYPDRFSEAQRADLQRLCLVSQQQLDALRAWPVANSDAPALYLKPLVEREKKNNAAPNLKSAPQGAKPEASTKPSASGKH